MINDCKSLKLFEHLQRYSQTQTHPHNHQDESDHRLHCQPSQNYSQSQSSLEREIQQFKKDIEQKFQLSIANKLYTFPKRIKTIFDILSSEQEEISQEKCQKQVKKQRQVSKNARQRDTVKSNSRRRLNMKESTQILNSNSISPLKSKHLKDASTNKKKDKNLTEKSASKTKRHPKPAEQKQKNEKTSKVSQKKTKMKQKPLKQANHRFLQTIMNKTRKA